jgi:hypothetical protein
MKKTAFVVCVFAILWPALSGAVSAATVATNTTPTTLPHNAEWPRISGDRLVYESDIGDFTNHIRQIYLYDINSKTTTQITNDTFGSRGADIDGSRVVYIRENGDGTYSLMLYTVGSGTVELVSGLDASQGIGSNDYPRIAGNYAAYSTYIAGTGLRDMFYVNLTESPVVPHQIGPSDGNHYAPQIAGTRVVYSIGGRAGKGDDDVWMYDINSSVETQITSSNFTERIPAVFGDYVVYSTNAAGHWESAIYNILTQTTQPMEPGTQTQGTYGVDKAGGPWIVYYTYDPILSYDHLYAYNNLTGKVMTITKPSEWQDYAALSGKRAAWTQRRGNNNSLYDVYVGELASDVPPVFVNLPGTASPINVAEGQTITVNPYTVNVYPTDEFGISKVEFYIDGILRGTTTTPDVTGAYSFVWDTFAYHSNLRVVAYNTAGLTAELTRTATVTLPYTGR